MKPIPFIPGHIYKRSAIHDQYKGNRQGGISPSASFPYVFIFSGKSGTQYGYEDGWINPSVFSYTGEGQIGDMQFIKGNRALKEHISTGKRVFLFEYKQRGFVEFISELEFYDIGYFETPDANKNSRIGIKFFLKKKGAVVPVNPDQLEIGLTNNDNPIPKELVPNITERSGLVTSRVGQGAYRKSIIHRWEYQCAVTKLNKIELLIASHIVPWSEATNEERLSVHNGILLSPTYDALFDRHLISFDNNGKILLSDSIEVAAYEKIGVTGKERIVGLSDYNHYFLERHRSFLK